MPLKFTEDQIKRYSRQIILPEVGGKGQRKLLSSRVLVIGAGGLGSSAIAYLAAAGIGTLGIIDSDTVEISNLQRQIIHGSSLGAPKARSAEHFIRTLNSDVNVVALEERLIGENARMIIRGYDFVVDGSDNFPTHYLINDACVLEKKAFSHSSIMRYEGYATTVVPEQGPCYRCLFKKAPPPRACTQLPGGRGIWSSARDHRLHPGGRGPEVPPGNRQDTGRKAPLL